MENMTSVYYSDGVWPIPLEKGRAIVNAGFRWSDQGFAGGMVITVPGGNIGRASCCPARQPSTAAIAATAPMITWRFPERLLCLNRCVETWNALCI
jgi:hypothetical protein